MPIDPSGLVGAAISVIPWSDVWHTPISEAVTVIGSENSGKTTYLDVLYNLGKLVSIRDYERTNKIEGRGSLKVTLTRAIW